LIGNKPPDGTGASIKLEPEWREFVVHENGLKIFGGSTWLVLGVVMRQRPTLLNDHSAGFNSKAAFPIHVLLPGMQFPLVRISCEIAALTHNV